MNHRPQSESHPAEAPPGKFVALTFRNYRLFFSGQLISVTGMWMQSLAMSWLLVQTLQASPLQLGLLQVFQFGPILLLGIPAGIVADRFPKRNILQATQSIFFLMSVLLTWLVISDRLELWQIYAISTVFGITNSLDMPSRQAIVSELVPAYALKNAIALNASMFNLGRLLGPSIAGVVLARWGAGACFALNTAAYLGPITAYTLMRIKTEIIPQVGSPVERLKAGVNYIRETGEILRPIILVGTVATIGMNHNVWVPLVATQSLNADERTYGFLFTAMGIGSLAGALSVAFSSKNPTLHKLLIYAAGLGITTVALGVFSSIPLTAPVIALMLALNGFCLPSLMASANTIVQTTAPAEFRGRVMAVYTTIFLGTAPIGGLTAGALSDRFGVEMAMLIAGVATLVITLLFVRNGRSPRSVSVNAPAT